MTGQIRFNGTIILQINSIEAVKEVLVRVQPEYTENARILSLPNITTETGVIPKDCVLLGIAEDGLPLLLNVRNAVCGSILLVADEQSGKTTFLQSVARQIHRTNSEMRFGVITPSPWEWERYRWSNKCIGISDANATNTETLINALSDWIQWNTANVPTFLLIDNLDALSNLDIRTQIALQRIIQFGPSRNIWPIATLAPTRTFGIESWPTQFPTHIVGFMAHNRFASTLIRGWQFAMATDSSWLKFFLLD